MREGACPSPCERVSVRVWRSGVWPWPLARDLCVAEACVRRADAEKKNEVKRADGEDAVCRSRLHFACHAAPGGTPPRHRDPTQAVVLLCVRRHARVP